MRRVGVSIGAVSLVLLLAGCTPVQKGTAAGGAVGGATGAAVGHYMTSLGGVPGGLVGLGLGAGAGAVASEYYYGSDDSEEVAGLTQTVDQLAAELEARQGELGQAQADLEKERAQQKALLEAYERARQQERPAATAAAQAPAESHLLSASMPASIQVSAGQDGITYTILSEVLFDSGSAELSKAGRAALQAAARDIRASHPDAVVEVRGHTDNVPIRYSPFKSNWHLSCERAVSVVQHLIQSEGFSPARLKATGCGETQPIASNSTPEGRRKNRRAEIVVRPAGARVAEARAVR